MQEQLRYQNFQKMYYIFQNNKLKLVVEVNDASEKTKNLRNILF